MKRTLLITVLIIIVLSNIPPIKSVLGVLLNDDWYRYSNGNGSYTFVDQQLSNSIYRLNKIVPLSCRTENNGDTIVYRLFYRNPLRFWNWAEYFYSKKYQMEFKSWDKIKRKRAYILKFSNNCQQF